jgi:hypothetical protein
VVLSNTTSVDVNGSFFFFADSARVVTDLLESRECLRYAIADEVDCPLRA